MECLRLGADRSQKEAWDALFRYFNQAHGTGDVGYRSGEKIAIKINENQNRSGTWNTGQAVPSPDMAYAPKCVTEARHLVNMSLLRAHILFGVTQAAKNHFGWVYFPNRGWAPAPLHGFGGLNRPVGSYNCLVDPIGHRQLGGKTML